MMEIIDYAERNPKVDMRKYISGKFDELYSQIKSMQSYPDKSKDDAIDFIKTTHQYVFNTAKVGDQEVIRDGKPVYYIRDADFRLELQRLKPLVLKLTPNSDEYVNAGIKQGKFTNTVSIEDMSILINTYSKYSTDTKVLSDNNSSIKSVYEGNPNNNIRAASAALHNLGLYSCTVDSYERGQQQLLSQAASQAKEQAVALQGKVVPINGQSSGTPLNGQANQEQDITKVATRK